MNTLSEEYVVTSVLEFADRYEGQIFHRGELDGCEQVSASLSAISVSGTEAPVSAKMVIANARDFDHQPGFRWRMNKPAQGGA